MFNLKSLKYSFKFYLGAGLFIFSLIIGKITLTTFILYYHDPVIRWISVAFYITSWPLLILGIWWVGTEYAKALNRYFSYRFYHETVKTGVRKGAEKFISRTRDIHSRVRSKVQSRFNRNISKDDQNQV